RDGETIHNRELVLGQAEVRLACAEYHQQRPGTGSKRERINAGAEWRAVHDDHVVGAAESPEEFRQPRAAQQLRAFPATGSARYQREVRVRRVTDDLAPSRTTHQVLEQSGLL